MVFSSVTFLFFFLPAVLILNFILPARFRNYLLIFSSLLFYWWGEYDFVLVMLVSIAANYLIGLAIQRSRRATFKKRWVTLGIVFNLGILGFFKYAGFLASNIGLIWESAGGRAFEDLDLHLPIGISFFTFQALSYIIDVYREEETAMKRPDGVALYISSFPQLIAGPIVRYSQIKKQLRLRWSSADKVSYGIKRFVTGLGKKILIANTLAVAADNIFALPTEGLSFATAWLGIVCYTLQIYFDFSGYSDMAIGLGHMLGFTFPENFNYPYISKSVREFWQRWHISLSTWFRDYLYIPLGGNRHGAFRTFRNLLIVFFLCGLWHGASWNFVIWGLFHGLFLGLERGRLFSRFLSQAAWPARGYTLFVVMVGWVFFRSETLSQSIAYLGAMFGLSSGALSSYPVQLYFTNETWLVLCVGVIGATPIFSHLRQKVLRIDSKPHLGKVSLMVWRAMHVHETLFLGVVLLFCALKLSAGTYNPFIYFRF